jgi:hypothetical protein
MATSAVLSAFVREWRKSLTGDPRARLARYDARIKRAVATEALENTRRWLPLDWVVRIYTPAWLDLVPALRTHAAALRALAPMRDAATLARAQPTLDAAQRATAAARDAAWDAAGDAARDSAWDAAWDAARDSARDSAWASARDAAGDAAWDSARDAAWYAARDAARDSAWAAPAGGERAAADAALAPIVARLQDSAFALLDRMLAAGYECTEFDVKTLRRVTPAAGQEGIDYLEQSVGVRVQVQPGGRGMIVQPQDAISPTLAAKLRSALPGSWWDAVPDEFPALHWWAQPSRACHTARMASQSSPFVWAERKLSRNERDWAGPLGVAVRAFAPRLFPGAPPEAFLGFTANGRIDKRTSANELGYFGVPQGTWNRLRTDPRVTKLLGNYPPPSSPDSGWSNAVRDQAAVGLAQLQDHYRGVVAGLPPAIRPAGPGTLWGLALTFGGWSAGSGRMAAHVKRYAAALALVPEARRWPAFLEAVAYDGEAGQLPNAGIADHPNPAYTALRTWQKLAAGRLLAARTGGATGWFDLGLGAAREAKLAATITSLGNATGPAAGYKGAPDRALLWGVALGAGLAGSYLAWERYGARLAPKLPSALRRMLPTPQRGR